MADARAQIEARLKRTEREHAEAIKRAEAAEAARMQLHRDVLIGRAMSGQKFRNAQDAQVLIQHRVVAEGDELLFRDDSGRLVPLEDGIASFAKARPDYVEAAPVERGSGFKGAGRASAAVVNPWAKESFNLTAQIEMRRADPQLAEQMRAAADGATPQN